MSGEVSEGQNQPALGVQKLLQRSLTDPEVIIQLAKVPEVADHLPTLTGNQYEELWENWYALLVRTIDQSEGKLFVSNLVATMRELK